MNKLLLMILAVVAVLGLSGCKIVYDEDKDTTAIPDGPEGDDARNAQRIADTFDSQLLPLIRDKALPVAELRAAVTADLDAAGEANANRGSGRGAAWNFPVSGTGTVIEAKLDSRARALSLDTDNDGAADLTLQLGPVIRGTALRDAAPFYDFDEFRDQIEFAKLSRALNDRIPDLVTVPEGDLIGTSVSFIGVVPLKKADEKMMVTPIEVTFGS